MTYSSLTKKKKIQPYDVESVIRKLEAMSLSRVPAHIKEIIVSVANVSQRLLHEEICRLSPQHSNFSKNPEKYTIQNIESRSENVKTLFRNMMCVDQQTIKQLNEDCTNDLIVLHDYFCPNYDLTKDEKKVLYALVAPRKFKRTKSILLDKTHILYFLTFFAGDIQIYKPTASSYKLFYGRHEYASDNFDKLLQFLSDFMRKNLDDLHNRGKKHNPNPIEKLHFDRQFPTNFKRS